MGLISYLGESKIIKRICELLNVTDVQDGEGHSLVDENGIAIVSGGSGASALDDLTDVSITTPTDYQALVYDDTDDLWKNASLSIPGAINDLSDVNISSPSNKQVFQYNSTSSKWENKDASWLPLSGGTLTGGLSVKRPASQYGNDISVQVGGNSNAGGPGVKGIIKILNASGGSVSLISQTGNLSNYDVTVPQKTGTIALTSDLPSDFVPASTGGTFEGNIVIDKADGTTSANGISMLTLGNATASGTEGNSYGQIRLYTTDTGYMDLLPVNANLMKFVGQLRVSRDNGTASSSENYTILEVGNNVANTSDGHAEGGIRVWDINGYRHTITGPTLSSGKSTGNANYRLPGSGGTFVMDKDIYTDDVPVYTPSGGTAYNAQQMVLYLHNYVLDDKDMQKVCCKVGYSTSDMLVFGYRVSSSRGRYIYMTRTSDDIYVCRITGTKAMNYAKITREATSSVTID